MCWRERLQLEPDTVLLLAPASLAQDVSLLKRLVQEHLRYTGSEVARAILLNWERERRAFVKVRGAGAAQAECSDAWAGRRSGRGGPQLMAALLPPGPSRYSPTSTAARWLRQTRSRGPRRHRRRCSSRAVRTGMGRACGGPHPAHVA